MYSRKEIWRISLPILVSLFVQNLINITDTAFMGRVGQVELGASALAGVLYLAFYMVTFGFSTGAQILMARRNGEAKYGTLGPIMGQGILFLEIFSIILIFASLIGTPQMLKGLISSTAVCQAGEDYMQYRIFGLLFTSIGVMFRAFFVAVTRTKVLMINAVIMTVANVVFNYIFVFGHFGAPEMGIAGKYQLFRFRSGGFGLIREILNVSVWSMILYFLTIGTWFLFFVAVEHLGELPLAISNIIRSTSTLLFMPVNAFGATACTLVSNAMGARRALPGNILFQSVSGTGDTRTAFLIEMTTIVFYTLAIYWIIVTLQVDIAFCWTVEYVYWGFKLFLSFLFFKKTNWKVKKFLGN